MKNQIPKIYTILILVLVYPGSTTFKKLRKPFKQLTKHGFLGSGFGDAFSGLLRYAPAFYDTTHKAYKSLFGGSHHKHKPKHYAPGYQYDNLGHYDNYGSTKYGSGFGHFDEYTPYHSSGFYPTSYHSFDSFDSHIPSFKDVFHSDFNSLGSDFFHYPKLYDNHDFFDHSIHNILR